MNKNTVAGLFAILASTIAFLVSKDVLITISAFLFALFLAISLRPLYQGLFKSKKELPTTITVLRERGFEAGVPEERVLYALLITQDIIPDVENAELKPILEDIFERSVVTMSEKYDFFRSRYLSLQEKALPLKICCGTCTENRKSIGKCYRDWMKTVRINNSTYPSKENIDLFFDDLQFTDPDGITHNAVTAVQFYRW